MLFSLNEISSWSHCFPVNYFIINFKSRSGSLNVPILGLLTPCWWNFNFFPRLIHFISMFMNSSVYSFLQNIRSSSLLIKSDTLVDHPHLQLEVAIARVARRDARWCCHQQCVPFVTSQRVNFQKWFRKWLQAKMIPHIVGSLSRQVWSCDPEKTFFCSDSVSPPGCDVEPSSAAEWVVFQPHILDAAARSWLCRKGRCEAGCHSAGWQSEVVLWVKGEEGGRVENREPHLVAGEKDVAVVVFCPCPCEGGC